MGEFLNHYVLKPREDNGRCDVSAIFTDLIYVDVDEDKPFGLKLIKNEETRPNNNLISLYFFISFFSFFFIVRSWKFVLKFSILTHLTFPTLSRFEGWVGVTEWKCVISCDMYIILCIERRGSYFSFWVR